MITKYISAVITAIKEVHLENKLVKNWIEWEEYRKLKKKKEYKAYLKSTRESSSLDLGLPKKVFNDKK